jgi:hypothetical protein
MFVAAAEFCDQLLPIAFRIGQFAEQGPDGHNRHHDQRGNQKELHDVTGRRWCHRWQFLRPTACRRIILSL